MRDLPEKRFNTCATGMGFGLCLVVDNSGVWFVADDGVRCAPVLHPGTVRVQRRETLARMSQLRKRQPYPANSEATGAGTPMAS